MSKNIITITVTRSQLFLLIAILIAAVISVSFLRTRAAFIEPAAGPASSSQDFAQNILGANNANNDFNSSAVIANADGSIIERLQQMTEAITDTVDYSLQKNELYCDWMLDASSTPNSLAYAYANQVDGNLEEAVWESATDTTLGSQTIASGIVMHDPRTGLYWSDCYSSAQDGTCDERTNVYALNGVIADANDGLDAEGGQAVDFCEALSLDSDGDGTDETDWYLPGDKELMTAYVNGIVNNAPNCTSANTYWTSTDYFSSSGASAHTALLYKGGFSNATKTTTGLHARCVRR